MENHWLRNLAKCCLEFRQFFSEKGLAGVHVIDALSVGQKIQVDLQKLQFSVTTYNCKYAYFCNKPAR